MLTFQWVLTRQLHRPNQLRICGTGNFYFSKKAEFLAIVLEKTSTFLSFLYRLYYTITTHRKCDDNICSICEYNLHGPTTYVTKGKMSFRCVTVLPVCHNCSTLGAQVQLGGA